MFISVSSWLSPHLTFSFDTLLGIIISCWRLFSSTRSLLMAKATPILLEYCPLVIILILGTTSSICAVSSSVVLSSCFARIAILLSLIILAILGHFELWALSFFPLMFQDANVILFSFLNLDWNCFLVSSCSVMSISLSSVSSVDKSVSLQKGFHFLGQNPTVHGWILWFLILWGGLFHFLSISTGLVLSAMIMLRWFISLLSVGVLCFSAHVPRLGTIELSMGVARLCPSLPPFCPLAFWPTRGLDVRLSPEDAF